MEFLDSLDLDTKHRKAHRVRSWYLYEQYKSLERHQLDAAQKLKDRTYQDKLLRQELSERRARRKLYDQFGLCQSESRISKGIITPDDTLSKTLSVSNDEFFESFSEQEDERVTQNTEFVDKCKEELTASYCDLMEGLKSTTELKDCVSSVSINSVMEKQIPNGPCNECPREDSQDSPISIVRDLNKQLDAVKQDFENLESITKFEDVSKSSECESEGYADNCELTNAAFIDNKEHTFNNNIIFIWSRLVSFAYQVVQLNHGNCYCDYSSQFLTAVLACDVLRRGVNRMCYTLQPYVSPIKFASEESVAFEKCCKKGEIKKSVQSRKSKKSFEKKLWHQSKRFEKGTRHAHKNYSRNSWQHCCRRKSSFETKNPRRASEMLRCASKYPHKAMSSSSSSSFILRVEKKSKSKSVLKKCGCCHKVINPMLQLARYLDRILKDTEEYSM